MQMSKLVAAAAGFTFLPNASRNLPDGSNFHDAVVARIGDVDVAGRVDRDALRVAELIAPAAVPARHAVRGHGADVEGVTDPGRLTPNPIARLKVPSAARAVPTSATRSPITNAAIRMVLSVTLASTSTSCARTSTPTDRAWPW
jgi:hypothetical protein